MEQMKVQHKGSGGEKQGVENTWVYEREGESCTLSGDMWSGVLMVISDERGLWHWDNSVLNRPHKL